MAQDMTDEEQLQVLKNWWKENGRSLMLTIFAALAAYFGWQWWNQYQQNYAEEASRIYQELTDAVAVQEGQTLSDEKRSTAQFLIEQLQNDYGRTLYAVNASLLAAKMAVDQGDLNTAEQQLKKALQQGDEDSQVIASLRLARVYLAQEKYDLALEQAQYDKDDSFSGLFAAIRGDIFVGKGAIDDAKASYNLALEKLGAESNLHRRMVEIKLSDLNAGNQ